MKKSTKRTILCAGLAALMSVSLCGCDRNTTPSVSMPEQTATEEQAREKYTSLSQLQGKAIGIQSGTSMDQTVISKISDVEFKSYDTYPALVDAMKKGRVEAFPGDEPVILQLMANDSELSMINEFIDTFEFGYAFKKDEKGQALCDEFSEYIKSIESSGELKEVKDKWTGADESLKTVEDYTALPATNGTLRMVTEGAYEPFNYFKDGKIVGYDIDVAVRFCKAKGYGLEVEMMEFDQIIDAVAAGEYDFAGAGITITPEREEKVYFSEPNYSGGVVMCVLK